MVASGTARWVVDGNNVMGSRPDGWWRDRRGAARRLVAELRRHPWPEGADVTVVFDGPGEEPDDESGPVRVVHSGRDRSADDVIADEAGRGDGPVVVVTSDRALRERVRAVGAEIVPSGGLLARLERGQPERPR